MLALITGGAGFIGSHLTDRLLAQGWGVRVLDDLSTGRLDNLAEAMAGPHSAALEFTEGSVTDADLVHRLCDGVDVVFHLAAAVGVFTIQQETLRSLRTNLHGTENALDAALATGARMVLASTSEVYGKNTSPGLHETADRVLGSPLLSRWSYAEAKAIDEAFAQQYHLSLGLETVIVRLFNTTGPRQAGRYGMVLPRLATQALAGEPLTVFGDGEQTRCFTHVDDVVRALETLAHTPEAIGHVYNIGNPQPVSINELARLIVDRVGSRSDIVHVDYETAYGPGFEDMQCRVPDISELAALIGYAPRHDLSDAIDSVVASLRDRGVEALAPVGASAPTTT